MTTTGSARIATIRDQLAQKRESFLTTVRSLSEEDLGRSVWSEGSQWSAKDLIGHVAYAEGSMLPIITNALAGKPAQANPEFDLARFNDGRVRRASTQSVDELLDRLTASRQEMMALLEQLSDADLERPCYHPTLHETNVEGVLNIIGQHELLHGRDLQAIKATIADQ